MELAFNHYGKRAVRLLRVRRDQSSHQPAELEVSVLVEGALGGSYHSSDNTSVVPTDTIKNTVLALAHDHPEVSRDAFARLLAAHFPAAYAHLIACDVEVRERLWTRKTVAGTPHPHCFVRDGNGEPFSRVRAESGGIQRRTGGIRGFVIMKTTESGFSGFPRCELTTLPETDDRILATSLDVEWKYTGDLTDIESAALETLIEEFARAFSPSVQRTLFLMGEAVLGRFPGVSEIRLAMPNKHYLPLDLSRLGRPADQRVVFLPTDEPFGFIEAVVAR